MADRRDSVHLPGPKYVRSLGSLADRDVVAGERGTMAVLLDRVDDSLAIALAEVLERALDTESGVYVVFLMRDHERHTASEVLSLGREIGDQLTAWVLRLCGGHLPRTVNIVVYWGDLPDVLTFVTSSIHPDVVTIVCGDGRTGARLAAEILRLQGCPVLLIPRGFPSAGARGLRKADWAALVN